MSMKIYQYFSTYDDMLYACTDNKTLAKEFERTRDMNKYYKEKFVLSKSRYTEYELYFENNRHEEMTILELVDKKGRTHEVVATISECLYMDSLINQWESTFADNVETVIYTYGMCISGYTRSALRTLAQQIKSDEITIDTLKLFKKLYDLK